MFCVCWLAVISVCKSVRSHFSVVTVFVKQVMVLSVLLYFSAEALSAVFTSDKLLLAVLVNVLHSNIETVAAADSCSADAVETSPKQLFTDKAGRNLPRQKSAEMPAEHNLVSCKSRRLSDPLISSSEQMQSSMPWPLANGSQAAGTRGDSSAVVGGVSKPFSFRGYPLSLSSKLPHHRRVAAASCSVNPYVNPAYTSDDCSTLKSLSFEKRDSRLPEHTCVAHHVQCKPQNGDIDSASDHHVLLSTSEERCGTKVTVMPVLSDCTTQENFTFADVPTSETSTGSNNCTNTNTSCQLTGTNEETRGVCTRFGYRKICVYLQEGTWRHSPHSLHCIQIGGGISLVVFCEVTCWS